MSIQRIIQVSLILLLAGLWGAPAQRVRAQSSPVTYDIVYVRQPRHGDNQHALWPEVCHPGRVEPGSDLMLLHPNGVEEVLVAGGNGAVTDPFVAFDGQWVYYAYFPDVRLEQSNSQRGDLPYAGSDIYRLNLQTRAIERLTHQEFTPNLGAGQWNPADPINAPEPYNRLGYGILNLGPAPLPGGKVIFTSNRNGFVPTKELSFPTMQLFVMDADGANVTPIAPMTIGSALHPMPLQDGRVIFSTYETQGMRDSRLWGIWDIWPDGRLWGPVLSAFKYATSFHFATQLSNSDLVVTSYYNCNNFSFGALYRFPVNPPAGQPRFHSAFVNENPPIAQMAAGGFSWPAYMGFTPRGLLSITPFTHGEDDAAPCADGTTTCDPKTRVGKFTHPAAAPNNDLLVVWSPGPVNVLERPVAYPAVDAGLYLIRNGGPANSPADLTLIKNNPNYNEVWPRPVVTYQAIHGGSEPVALPWLPNDGAVRSDLPAGTPYGLVGTSSLYKRESFPGVVIPWSNTFDGLDAFNTGENDQSSNWGWQGADAGKYGNSDIWAIRLLAMEANTHRSYGAHEGQHFFNHINEKLRILGEIPVRKFDGSGNPILDPEGNPDTSFLAKIPADTPFTFQLLDRNGMALNVAQTWHQVRPGELRADCGGCHAHSQQPLNFNQTAAAQASYPVWNLASTTPLLTQDASGNPAVRTVNAGVVNVEFLRDIRPLLQRSCVSCHTGTAAAGNLRLEQTSLIDGPPWSGIRLPLDYARLCFDKAARWGYAPVIGREAGWRQTNASRYVRPFQSRRSLLIWKLFGQRLDGWSNAAHPTESAPGNPATLPAGADPNAADLDYTGTLMPPPGSGVTPLTFDEKLLFVRWVDLGCPINAGQGDNANFGWFLDDQRPALAVSSPRPGQNNGPINLLRVGVADAYTGIAPGSLSIKASFAVNGRAAGSELADLAQSSTGGIYVINLNSPLTNLSNAMLYVQVADGQGNVTRVEQKFSVVSNMGSISGLVTNSGNAPLSGIRATAYRRSGNQWVAVLSAASNSLGRYRINNLAPDNYRVRFYDRNGRYITEWYNNVARVGLGTNVAVTVGNVTTGIDASLAAVVTAQEGAPTAIDGLSLNFQGAIVDAQGGAPIANARVILYEMPGWSPRLNAEDSTPERCESLASKPVDAAWSQPAPTELGIPVSVEADAELATQVQPSANAFITGSNGGFGWQISPGCFYVEVEAEGYASLISPLVGVNAEPISLTLTLAQAENWSYLPMVVK